MRPEEKESDRERAISEPQTGDVMVIHGIGTLADGKEFWNTRTDGSPYEYTPGVQSVIRGFSEGMRFVREGNRLIITMKPELAHGARERPGIPANSTLTLGLTLLPDAYRLHQTLGRPQATRGDKSAASKRDETPLKLNPKKTPAEIREATTAALAALR
jgi:FKBP-type peptidyl-prolyl cis-trans isomerase FkpA